MECVLNIFAFISDHLEWMIFEFPWILYLSEIYWNALEWVKKFKLRQIKQGKFGCPDSILIPKCFSYGRKTCNCDYMLGTNLSPEGNLQSRSRKGSIWVSYTLSSSFQVGYWKCRFPPRKRKCQNALLCGWVDGWTGYEISPLSISLFSSMIISNISRIQKCA